MLLDCSWPTTSNESWTKAGNYPWRDQQAMALMTAQAYHSPTLRGEQTWDELLNKVDSMYHQWVMAPWYHYTRFFFVANLYHHIKWYIHHGILNQNSPSWLFLLQIQKLRLASMKLSRSITASKDLAESLYLMPALSELTLSSLPHLVWLHDIFYIQIAQTPRPKVSIRLTKKWYRKLRFKCT